LIFVEIPTPYSLLPTPHVRHKSAIAKIKVGVSIAMIELTDVAATGKLGPPYLIATEIPTERIKTLRTKFALVSIQLKLLKATTDFKISK
jgi:hypothetical protein